MRALVAGVVCIVAFPVIGHETARQQVLTAQEVWRVSADQGDSIVFDDITDIAVDARGSVYVLDAKRPRVTVIDSAGKIVRTMGHKGAGPAELISPTGLVVGADGSIWVQDPGAGRVIVFGPDGSHKAAYPFRPRMVSIPWNAVMLESGDLGDHKGDTRPVGAGYGWVVRTHPLNGSLVVRDSIALGGDPARKMLGTHNKSVVPNAPSLRFGIAPQGFIWMANTAEYKVRKIGFDGTVLLTVEQPFKPLPIPESSRAASAKFVSDYIKETVAMSEIPTTYPALSNLNVGLDGSVWIVRAATSNEKASTYERFSAAGRQLPSVVMPATSYPDAVVTARNVYAVVRSSDDVPSIVRFRIP